MPVRYFDKRKGIGRIINKICTIFQKGKRNYLPPYQVYGGSVYCTMPRYAVEYIFKSDITADLKKRLRNSLCGEETFFQTILGNSPYSNKIINNNLRYMDWNCKKTPKVLTEFENIYRGHSVYKKS